MKNFIGKLFGAFSDDLGIDLGTSNTLICMRKKGIILNEPSVVAISTKTKEIYEVGNKAKQMIGRTPANYETVRPLRNGVIADYEVTEKMLRAFYKIINVGLLFNKPRVIICVPAGITQVEKRAVMEVTREAFEPEGTMIVDIGGGTSELAVISLGGVVKKSSFRTAGDKFDGAIVEYVRQKHNLLIGEKTAEEIKVRIGSVVPVEEDVQIEVSGKNLLNGLPKDIILTSSELVETMSSLVQEIIEEIRVVFEKTPPELAADIRRRGIYVTGGGALLKGIDKKISAGLNLKVTIAEDPLNAVINGINTLLENFPTYSKVLVSTETDY